MVMEYSDDEEDEYDPRHAAMVSNFWAPKQPDSAELVGQDIDLADSMPGGPSDDFVPDSPHLSIPLFSSHSLKPTQSVAGMANARDVPRRGILSDIDLFRPSRSSKVCDPHSAFANLLTTAKEKAEREERTTMHPAMQIPGAFVTKEETKMIGSGEMACLRKPHLGEIVTDRGGKEGPSIVPVIEHTNQNVPSGSPKSPLQPGLGTLCSIPPKVRFQIWYEVFQAAVSKSSENGPQLVYEARTVIDYDSLTPEEDRKQSILSILAAHKHYIQGEDHRHDNLSIMRVSKQLHDETAGCFYCNRTLTMCFDCNKHSLILQRAEDKFTHFYAKIGDRCVARDFADTDFTRFRFHEVQIHPRRN